MSALRIENDAEGEPTVWNGQHALLRRCEVDPELWGLVVAGVETFDEQVTPVPSVARLMPTAAQLSTTLLDIPQVVNEQGFLQVSQAHWKHIQMAAAMLGMVESTARTAQRLATEVHEATMTVAAIVLALGGEVRVPHRTLHEAYQATLYREDSVRHDLVIYRAEIKEQK